MVELHVLRVFTDAAGDHGNPLGVVLDGGSVPPNLRQRLAAELGYSETVFVDDRARGLMRIFTPAAELGFAGHPTVGTAWLLAEDGSPPDVLNPPAGEVAVRRQGDLTFVAARPDWVSPPFQWHQLPGPADIDALEGPADGDSNSAFWAWEDEASGRVRSRVFPVGLGIAEDPATGAAAIDLASRLQRELQIRQGTGSKLIARPLPDGRAEVGGRTRFMTLRQLLL